MTIYLIKRFITLIKFQVPNLRKKFIIYNACYLREITQNNGKSKS